MKQMLAYCGSNCMQCPAFIATKTNDDTMREQTAKLWSEGFNTNLKAEDINCEGCLPDEGIKFSHCSVCYVRKCAIEKNLTNCGDCTDYFCDELEKFFNMVPDFKTRLDEYRANRQ